MENTIDPWPAINQLAKDKAGAKDVDQLLRDFRDLEARCTILESRVTNLVRLLAPLQPHDAAHP